MPHGSFQPPVTFKIPRLSCSGYPRSQVARPTTGCEGPHSRGRWYRLRTSYAYSVLTPHGLPHDERFWLFAVKNVVLAGFGHITLLDLDTIDLSNLNRQFLFRKKDVKQSKALVRCSTPQVLHRLYPDPTAFPRFHQVAARTASAFNPSVHITPIHGNIKDTRFDLAWFKGFDIVLNALDNLGTPYVCSVLCENSRHSPVRRSTTRE